MSRHDAFNCKTGVKRIRMLQQCSNKPTPRKMCEAELHNTKKKTAHKRTFFAQDTVVP